MEKPTGVTRSAFLFLYNLNQLILKNSISFLLVGFLLIACDEQNSTDADATRTAEVMTRRLLNETDPLAVAIGLKYNVGADTVLAIVSHYARYHDSELSMQVFIKALGKAINEKDVTRSMAPLSDTTSQPPRRTQRELAIQFQLKSEMVGAIVYDYKAAKSNN